MGGVIKTCRGGNVSVMRPCMYVCVCVYKCSFYIGYTVRVRACVCPSVSLSLSLCV